MIGPPPAMMRAASHPPRRTVRAIAAMAAAVALVPLMHACRDTEPPRVLYQDLGENGAPLLPPAASAWMDPSLKDGRAEWHAFREPDMAQVHGESAPGETDAALHGATAAPPPGGEEARIRETLAERNALAADGKTDEMLDYYVESQIDMMTKLFERQAAAAGKMAMLRQALAAKLPNEADRVAAAFETLQSLANPMLTVGAITFRSDTEASGTAKELPGGAAVEFTRIDDVWYIKMPGQIVEGAIAAVDGIMPMFDQLMGLIESGQVPADQILTTVEQARTAAASAMGSQPSSGGASHGASPEFSQEILQRGAEAYRMGKCAKCHGENGTGSDRAPDLTDSEWLHADGSVDGIRKILLSGVPRGSLKDSNRPFAMNPATNLITDDQAIDALAAYVANLREE